MRLTDRALVKQLATELAPRQVLKYSQVVRTLIGPIDGEGGVVHDVYAGREVKAEEVGFGSRVTLNAEHTWPKSHGVAGTPALCDLHHLFPVDSEANRRRGNLPYGEVEQVQWSKGGARQGLDASGRAVFEPPDEHKGNAARAMFYVSAIYGLPLDDVEEATLKAWNHEDPPDAAERERSVRVEAIQGNVNPFVLDPSLADRIDDF